MTWHGPRRAMPRASDTRFTEFSCEFRAGYLGVIGPTRDRDACGSSKRSGQNAAAFPARPFWPLGGGPTP